MTMPPMGTAGPQQWMTVEDVFHIRNRGTVVTGQLQGTGLLNVGDTLVCDGQRWRIDRIEQFRAALTSAAPGQNIGIMLGKGPSGDVLRGRTVQFEPTVTAGQIAGYAISAARKKRWRR